MNSKTDPHIKSSKNTLPFAFLLAATAIILACEAIGGIVLNNILSSMQTIFILRTLELTFMLILLKYMDNGFEHLGISYRKSGKKTLYKGIKAGIVWSMIFGVAAFIIGVLMFCKNSKLPFDFIASKLPENSYDLALFMFTGCIISPFAEEFFFRGFLYSCFRRYGVLISMVISTLLFALCHMPDGRTITDIDNIPLIPLTGGIVFGLSYEYSKSLAAPVIIHVLGNIAIFA
ncbi:MAG: CPBP family intramembrane metalloprotease, partial [Desulfamplus sp.]|nr:CPBP family intramembrane metalloprotease [Desulfamplus sp.]